ncbi:MAG: hypothetical protein ACJAVK_000175, partial [Akkermansiaceae bacterium]
KTAKETMPKTLKSVFMAESKGKIMAHPKVVDSLAEKMLEEA